MASPRSVAEVLEAPFDALTLEHIGRVVERIRTDGETMFVELKRDAAPAGIAKSCAAFANSLGGLLVAGVANDGTIVGSDAPGGEPQVWVKDVLRDSVTPLPPFRARWLPLNAKDGKGLLLVLVERSSVTPHLLTRHGAIYVRIRDRATRSTSLISERCTSFWSAVVRPRTWRARRLRGLQARPPARCADAEWWRLCPPASAATRCTSCTWPITAPSASAFCSRSRRLGRA